MTEKISEEKIWKTIKNYFETKGLLQHQISSFNHFINIDIIDIIKDISKYSFEDDKKEFEKYEFKFDNIYIPHPTTIEETRELLNVTPQDCRIRNLNYDAPVYVDIIQKVHTRNKPPQITRYNRCIICRIPIMLGRTSVY